MITESGSTPYANITYGDIPIDSKSLLGVLYPWGYVPNPWHITNRRRSAWMQPDFGKGEE